MDDLNRETVPSFRAKLEAHPGMRARREESERRWHHARSLSADKRYFSDPGLTVFVAGSMGRGEMGQRSDLDLFIVSVKDFSAPEKEWLIDSLDAFNSELQYPPFSNRRFVKVYELGSMLKNTGSPEDDQENYFTARMLLLLESRSIANDNTYELIRDQVLGQYFRDERGKASYRPLFLLNDVLRYWRTLCLNYEDLRHDRDRPWWKKNVNLKFSRMLTVAATVAALTVDEVPRRDVFRPACKLTPLQRLAEALDRLDDQNLLEPFQAFLDDYEQFLQWKEDENINMRAEERAFKILVAETAERFSSFLYRVLMHERIPETRRKYLVL